MTSGLKVDFTLGELAYLLVLLEDRAETLQDMAKGEYSTVVHEAIDERVVMIERMRGRIESAFGLGSLSNIPNL